jgi:hypothetical protein
LEVFTRLEDKADRGISRNVRLRDELDTGRRDADVEDSEGAFVLGCTDEHLRIRRRSEQCEGLWLQEGGEGGGRWCKAALEGNSALAMLRSNGVRCIDVCDVQRCSVRQVEAAVGVEAVGGAALDGVEGEVSTHHEAPKVPAGGLHALQTSHDFENFNRGMRGREKGGAVILRPVIGHVAARLHVGITADRRVHEEVSTGAVFDVVHERMGRDGRV